MKDRRRLLLGVIVVLHIVKGKHRPDSKDDAGEKREYDACSHYSLCTTWRHFLEQQMCYSEGMKPILFLDFDLTLFDTDLFYEWLGEDEAEGVENLLAGKVPAPDFHAMLYGDTWDFLLKMKENYSLVLLTYSTYASLQELKVRESGVLPLLDDVIITKEEKGAAIQSYLSNMGKHSDMNTMHVFIDDDRQNIESVKVIMPSVFCVQINRSNLLPGEAPSAVLPDAMVGDLVEFARLLSTVRA